MTENQAENGETGAGSRAIQSDHSGAVFVLDRTENPHPRMLGEALLARSIKFDSSEALAYWHGYLAAMCGATGCPPDEIEAWMDHHEGGTDVPLPHRRLQ